MGKVKSAPEKMLFKDYLKWLDQHQKTFQSKSKKKIEPLHPGHMLKRDFLIKEGLTQTDLAKKIGCTYAKLNEVVNGKRGVTPRFALDLERATKIKAETWLRVQSYYDLFILRG